jgi:hypothetical protein
LVDKPGDTSCALPLDRGSRFKLKAEISEEINRLPDVIDDDSCLIHPLERHASTA